MIIFFWGRWRSIKVFVPSLFNKEIRIIKYALIFTFIGYLTQNLFNFDTITSQIYVFLWLGLSNFLINHKESKENNDSKIALRNQTSKNDLPEIAITKRRKFAIWLTLIILFPLFVFSLKNYHLDFFYANSKHNQAEILFNVSKYDKTFPLYEDCLKKWTYIPHTCRHKYASSLLAYGIGYKFSQPEKAKEYLEKAFSLLEQNFKEERPDRKSVV